jgi:hypothetical protein
MARQHDRRQLSDKVQFWRDMLLLWQASGQGYLRAVEGHRSGAKTSAGKSPRTYVLVDSEIVVRRKGGKVRIVLTGPGVEMTREEWREWLEERLNEAQ